MTKYFKTRVEAVATMLAECKAQFPESRIVDFEKGYAIQYYKSGAYYPDCKVEAAASRYNPANWS